ncbi:hypothetical protein FHX08_001183 [Rhizobium sp. BK529]|nr:hypothetical protein [Rhizobium sp. BK529]TCS09206.1 hypothetical protein EV281_1011087 [Rhizobium sp. BK418]
MCKPNGEAGIPADCPRRGDCRGCSRAADFWDGLLEDRKASESPPFPSSLRPRPQLATAPYKRALPAG